MPVNRLIVESLDELSAVDKGANQHAHIVITKTAGGPVAENQTPDVLLKRIADTEAELAKANAKAAEQSATADALAKRLADIEEANATAAALDIAKSLPSIDKAEVLAPIVRRLRKAAAATGDATLADDAIALLRKAETATQVAAKSLGKPVGNSAEADVSPAVTLAKIAGEIMAKRGVDYPTAYAAACRENPDTYMAARAPQGN